MAPTESEKALRYIALLDAARCDGDWAALPELARKVEKHAPHRKCLAQTARTEALVSQSLADDPSATPSVDTSSLASTLESSTDLPEDVFEASVCLGWIQLLFNNPTEALARMPSPIPEALSHLPESVKSARRWIQISAIKGAYLIGQSHEKLSDVSAAAQAYGSALPLLAPSNAPPEAQAWSLRLLSRLCELAVQPESGKVVEEATMLGTFRRWAAFWSTSSAVAHSVASMSATNLAPVAGSDVWLAYYRTLSHLLATGLACDPSAGEFEPRVLSRDQCSSPSEFASARAKLRVELKQVGLAYEAFLLETTAFPRAGQRNKEVEAWVEAVMSHWRAECGWHSEEYLDIDGPTNRTPDKVALSRQTLQILYRAASKTFQSPSILRHLFTVHAFLAEFPLAIKAFDTYAEIATRARERTVRAGVPDSSHDDDSAAVWTFASAITVLTNFGGAAEAEKGYKVGTKLVEWLAVADIPPDCRALGLRAVGISNAHWARWTNDEKVRAELQEQAILFLNQSLDPELGQHENPETLFEYALSLAEIGKVTAAIRAVRLALLAAERNISLSTESSPASSGQLKSRSIARHLRLTRLWHLLALLLSAGEDFSTALKTCDAVFEVLGISKRSDVANVASLYMSDRHKEDLIELKMTQIALLEQSEGVSSALDSLNPLVYLFVDLFGTVPDLSGTESVPSTADTSATNPSSAHGSRIRSLRRPFSSRRESHSVARAQDGLHSSDSPHRFLGRLSIHDSLPRSGRSLLASRRSGRGTSRSRTVSVGRKSELGADEFGMTAPDGSAIFRAIPSDLSAGPDGFVAMPTIPDGLSDSDQPPADQSPRSEPWITEPFPSPVFPDADVERRKMGILIRIWLFIAHLFIRGGVYDSATGALHQAANFCTQLEGDTLRQSTSANSVATSGHWLGMESVDEFWAEISTMNGLMMLAQGLSFDAQDAFELALSRYPDHCAATVGLSNLLLDMSEGLMPLERPERTPEELPRLLANALEIPVTAPIFDFLSVRQPRPVANGPYGVNGVPVDGAAAGAPNGHQSNANVSLMSRDGASSSRLSPRQTRAIPIVVDGVSNGSTSPHGGVGIRSRDGATTPSSDTSDSQELDSKTPNPPTEAGLITAAPLETSETLAPDPSLPSSSAVAADLHKLAARDRAYGLLSALTRRAVGWNTPEAWYALGRASQASGDAEKARRQFWWCVGLEEKAPVRRWGSVAARRA